MNAMTPGVRTIRVGPALYLVTSIERCGGCGQPVRAGHTMRLGHLVRQTGGKGPQALICMDCARGRP